MKNALVPIACFLGLVTAAEAAPITVANGDFEAFDAAAPYTIAGVGDVWYGPAGFGYTGVAAKFAPVAGVYDNVAAGTSVGVVNGGGTMFQSLGVQIESGASYTLGGLFGNRNDYPYFGGAFGFYAGDASNIIGQMSFATPSTQGALEAFSYTFDSALFSAFAGQTLGILFTSSIGQITLDDLYVDVASASIQQLALETPIPGAFVLFGTAVAGAGFARARKKAAKA